MKETIKKIWGKWKGVTRVWGVFNSYIILTLFYFLIIGPVAIVRKLIKLRQTPQNSYWIKKEESDPESYKHQF
ncbi:MAG: hypothetical protein HYW70_03030 [Candidatus Nealsonbacteria bacterium]|nr:hypothetical protein [Candidatus Nealsonbacteria bacterium]